MWSTGPPVTKAGAARPRTRLQCLRTGQNRTAAHEAPSFGLLRSRCSVATLGLSRHSVERGTVLLAESS